MLKKLKDFYNNTYGKLIIMSWCLLIVCLIIKLFGGNWFELSTDNERFISLCAFVDEHQWLKMTINCTMYCFSTYFVICASVGQKYLTKKQSIFIFPYMITKSLISWHFYWIAFAMDIILLLGINTYISRKPLRSLLCFGLVNAFQIISLLMRGISAANIDYNNFIITTLLQIDYYLMIALYYLYAIRKEVK